MVFIQSCLDFLETPETSQNGESRTISSESDQNPNNKTQNPRFFSTSSPLLVTLLSENEKLDNFHAKINVCGTTFIDIVGGQNTNIISVPVYCNNRGCTNKGCQKHRGELFRKEHFQQQQAITKSMNRPKGWVFTGWVLHTWDSDKIKAFTRKKMLKLHHILKDTKFGATTEFSIHMELKFNEDGTVYLHWHVVMGGINCKIKTMRSLWGRVVKYEGAIAPSNVTSYVSKYASKTPNFYNSDFNQDWYHLVVYKTQMHRFSISKIESESMDGILKPAPSGFYPYSVLLAEAMSCYMRDSYLNYKTDEKIYHSLLEPPPITPLCVNHTLF